jgi:hypothetical protein
MVDKVKHQGDGGEHAEICDPWCDEPGAEPDEEKILAGYRERQVTDFSKCISNALHRGHLWRSFKDHIDEPESE